MDPDLASKEIVESFLQERYPDLVPLYPKIWEMTEPRTGVVPPKGVAKSSALSIAGADVALDLIVRIVIPLTVSLCSGLMSQAIFAKAHTKEQELKAAEDKERASHPEEKSLTEQEVKEAVEKQLASHPEARSMKKKDRTAWVNSVVTWFMSHQS